ncbi:MAG: hypothetical protein UY21_C0003G0048 [Microgenomates group bacterium GW2011_GWA1_48_10]|nr:MAG: hypothetical protein UY21_C0003G0048 [Microgenomates group bacterium GW2011_GWA1_48_10]
MIQTTDRNFSRRGAFPLFFLLAIGVAVAVGGVFVVREQFVKKGESGKATYNREKIWQQAENPKKLPEIKPEPEGELVSGPYTYKPVPGQGSVPTMPSFSIRAPSGWEKFSPGGITQVQFKSPETDRVDQEDGLYAQAKAQVSVSIQNAGNETLEEILARTKKTVTAPFEKMRVVGESEVTYADHPATRLDVELEGKGVIMRTVDYYFIVDGFLVHTTGTALNDFWTRRGPVINSSLSTFKLL